MGDPTSSGTSAAIERKLLQPRNSVAFFYAPLLAVSAIVLLFRSPTTAHRATVATLTLLAVLWRLAWTRLRDARHPAARPAFIAWTFVGSAIMATLALHDFLYVAPIVPFFLTMYVTLPFWWAFLANAFVLIPVDISFREMVRQDPGPTVAIVMMVVRLVVVFAVGVFVKTLLRQGDERGRLRVTLAAAERRSGVLEERQRLAREIHDTLAQGFAAIAAHLETAELSRQDREGPEWEHVGSARRVARSSLEEARRLMAALRPEVLEQADLPEAIRRVASDWSRRTGVPCEARITGDAVPLHRDIEVAMLRTAQESLANAWKHAHASRTAVTLSYLGDVVNLDVMDDGAGGAGEGSGSGGFGLRAMRERVELLGGSLHIESTRGEGTTIAVSLPMLQFTSEMPVYPMEEKRQ